MADITFALDEALSKHYKFPEPKSPITSKRGRDARMRALEKQYGGVPAAAKAAGISPQSWRDWKRGAHPPSARGLRRLEGAFARHIIRPAVLAGLDKKALPKSIWITAIVVGDPGTDKRPGSRYMNSEPFRMFRAEKIDVRRVVDGWMGGGGPGAVAALTAAIKEQYKIEFAFEGTGVGVHLV